MADMVSKHSKKVKLSLPRALNIQGQRYMPLFILYLGAILKKAVLLQA